MEKMSGIAKSHYLWAVICAIGYLGLLVPGVFDVLQPFGVIALWVPLTAIGLYAQHKWTPKAPLNMKVHYAWAIVCIAGMAANALQYVGILPLLPIFNYASVWLIVTAIGFAYTGYVWPKAKEAYYAGAALNAIVLIGMFVAMDVVGPNLFALLGAASVLPLAYAGWKN